CVRGMPVFCATCCARSPLPTMSRPPANSLRRACQGYCRPPAAPRAPPLAILVRRYTKSHYFWRTSAEIETKLPPDGVPAPVGSPRGPPPGRPETPVSAQRARQRGLRVLHPGLRRRVPRPVEAHNAPVAPGAMRVATARGVGRRVMKPGVERVGVAARQLEPARRGIDGGQREERRREPGRVYQE